MFSLSGVQSAGITLRLQSQRQCSSFELLNLSQLISLSDNDGAGSELWQSTSANDCWNKFGSVTVTRNNNCSRSFYKNKKGLARPIAFRQLEVWYKSIGLVMFAIRLGHLEIDFIGNSQDRELLENLKSK